MRLIQRYQVSVSKTVTPAPIDVDRLLAFLWQDHGQDGAIFYWMDCPDLGVGFQTSEVDRAMPNFVKRAGYAMYKAEVL